MNKRPLLTNYRADLCLLTAWLAGCVGVGLVGHLGGLLADQLGPDGGSVLAQFHAGDSALRLHLDANTQVGLGLPATLTGCELKEVDVADAQPLRELLSATGGQFVQVGSEFHRLLCVVRY